MEIYFMCNVLVSVPKILPLEASTCGRPLDYLGETRVKE